MKWNFDTQSYFVAPRAEVFPSNAFCFLAFPSPLLINWISWTTKFHGLRQLELYGLHCKGMAECQTDGVSFIAPLRLLIKRFRRPRSDFISSLSLHNRFVLFFRCHKFIKRKENASSQLLAKFSRHWPAFHNWTFMNDFHSRTNLKARRRSKKLTQRPCHVAARLACHRSLLSITPSITSCGLPK